MPFYIKKPIEIEAYRFGIDDMPDWFYEQIGKSIELAYVDGGLVPGAEIHTLEGLMTAKVGDYVIQGIKGEIYPCKADIFEASYDPVCKPFIAQFDDKLRLDELKETFRKGTIGPMSDFITNPVGADEPEECTLGCDFSVALDFIKGGHKAKRQGWNGKDQFVFLVKGSEFKVSREPLLSILGEGVDATYRPHIDMKYQDGSIGVWSPSMGDLMANDWEIVVDE